jgi:arylsulfatase A-like enzyme
MKNRLIGLFVTAAGLVTLLTGSGSSPAPQRPNIIYIFTDQQSRTMMSAAGNPWLKTPAMDYIARNGTRFTRAYTTNPVCTPARISLMTGRFPGYFKDKEGLRVTENVGAIRIPAVSQEVIQSSLATWLRRAGYDLVYGGKQHLPPSLTAEALGFRNVSKDERDDLAQSIGQYIAARPADPYFMVVSLINPHDICYMAIRDFAETDREKKLLETGAEELMTLDKAMRLPEGVSEEVFFAKYCPTLPLNYEPQHEEPRAIAHLLDGRNFRKNARQHYTDKQWRMHRWAYCRLTETVDQQVQTILDALRESGQEENTLILFSSDHGDMDAAHRMEHKSVLYEESVGVPFLAMWKGHIPAGQVDTTHLISSGLDLLPTVGDYAGVKAVADPRGRSLRPLLEGKKVNWRKTLGVESEVGRMVVSSEGLKYIRYEYGENEEQLLDLRRDPYETTHFTKSAAHAVALTRLRSEFDTEWFPAKR